MATIHPTAVIDPAATIGADVQIGPYCVIGPHVRLGDGVDLKSHVVVDGRTTIGDGTVVFPFAALGHAPQDLKYAGEPSRLEIGAHCRIREGVTMHTGTQGGGLLTRVGDRCLFMANAHVAHDCRLGDHVILVNNVMLGGHVQIGNYAILGGGAAIHQYVRIGDQAMVGGMSGVENDVIPYGLVMGERARLSGLNLVGLQRRGFEQDDIKMLRAAYRQVFAPEGTLAERLETALSAYSGNDLVMQILSFIEARGNRNLCLPR